MGPPFRRPGRFADHRRFPGNRSFRWPRTGQDAQQQAEVTNPVHHKSLLSGVGGTVAVVPEAHQQVGTHAHQLPEDVDLQKIGADDQTQHGAAEQRQVREKAHIALVMGP